ncbi:MAG: 50S ribosomal protein L24 [Thermoguttaceae bacterium]|jgi:large subunit ribosomal protein L24|nr:50S ribosomal protein L24 [Thermoguttaceae bacterium]
MRIKVNDTVLVTSGDDKGKRGRVLRVDRAGAKVVVEGVNKVWKHVRRSQKNPQGGRLSKELPIDLSKVQLVCTACNRPTRVGARLAADGSKERFCKKCGAALGQIAPAKARRATQEA